MDEHTKLIIAGVTLVVDILKMVIRSRTGRAKRNV